jgi:spore coat polysaccharide biosynthesis predicted glycosyltransferase SpsG
MVHLTSEIKNDKIFFLIITDEKNNQIFYNKNVYFTDKKNELKDFTLLVNLKNIQVILLDLLKYKKNYIKRIKEKFNIKIVHENEDYSCYSDLLVNCNLDVEKKSLKKHCNLISGNKYIIFNQKIKKYLSVKKKNQIFIYFGGSDPSDFTSIFINNLVNNLKQENFLIHIGNFKNREFQKKKEFKNIKFFSDGKKILQNLSQSKLAIVSAGNIMYESIFLNIKTIVVAHNNHQDKFAKIAKKYNLVQYYGTDKKVYLKSIYDFISTSDIKKQIKKNYIIDGNGNNRIMKQISKLINK